MPLLRDWTDSFTVDALDALTERFFTRLLMKVDDYGRFHSDARLLNSSLFPLKKDVRDTDISRWLAVCKQAGLLRCYVDAKGRAILEVNNFGQKKKFMKAVFDPPEGQAHLPLAPKTEAKRSRREGESEITPAANLPTESEVLTAAAMDGIASESAVKFFAHYEGNDLWINKHGRIVKWRVLLKSWAETDRTKGTHYGSNGKTGPGRVDRGLGTANEGIASQYAGLG